MNKAKVILNSVLVPAVVIALITGIALTTLAQTAAPRPLPSVQQSTVYACPMHPEVRADKPGNCAKCGMVLVPMVASSEVTEYRLKLETTPTVMKAAEKVQLRFVIYHPKTGEQVKRFNIVHDMPFHLFIVSRDLEHYQHIHPIQQNDGSFIVETTLPHAGHYETFSDFFPVGGTPQVIQRSCMVADDHGTEHHFSQTNLVPDQLLIKSVDGIRFELRLEPAQPVVGQPTLLKYYLINDETGQPIKDLQPYLGAWGHTVILREDSTGFLHSHSTRFIPVGIDRSRLLSGPRISFNTLFNQPGRYRIWSQVQRKDKVTTVSFTVDVSRLERIAKWDGNGWSALVGSPVKGLDGAVRALAVSGRDVYLGGDFTMVDGISASRIARWDGHQWFSLADGVNGKVWAIAVNGSDIYVGGDFTTAGGKRVNGIAKWDGRVWSGLGEGISEPGNTFTVPSVYALAVSGNDVYAGGRFAAAGRVPANGIAKWNGHNWSALGDGVRSGTNEGVVRALATRGKNLYAGGQFVTAGEVSAYNIAKWDGHSWSTLGSGIRGNLEQVLTVGVSRNIVYVGGRFTTAGGVSASNIAKWNGIHWSALPVQPYDGVWKIEVGTNSVYVGGVSFTLQNGVVAKGIVRWDGRTWSDLGDGVGNGSHTGPIMAIATTKSDLYVGGDSFIIPGARTPSAITAKWRVQK